MAYPRHQSQSQSQRQRHRHRDRQNPNLYAKYTHREEWLCQNDDKIREFWNAMRNFLEHANSDLLNNCSYEALCDFMAKNSLLFDDRD